MATQDSHSNISLLRNLWCSACEEDKDCISSILTFYGIYHRNDYANKELVVDESLNQIENRLQPCIDDIICWREVEKLISKCQPCVMDTQSWNNTRQLDVYFEQIRILLSFLSHRNDVLCKLAKEELGRILSKIWALGNDDF